MKQVYQFGGSGTLVPRKHFAHHHCVPQGAKNYRGQAIDYSRYLVVVPAVDLRDEKCFICAQPMSEVAQADGETIPFSPPLGGAGDSDAPLQ